MSKIANMNSINFEISISIKFELIIVLLFIWLSVKQLGWCCSQEMDSSQELIEYARKASSAYPYR